MSSSLLDKNLTMVLNAQWAPIGQISVRKALVAMCSEANGQKAAMGMDMETAIDENGDLVLVYSRPVEWSEWVVLPVRDTDLYVSTAHQKVRVPTIIITGYAKIPMKRPRLGKAAIAKRDGNTCQYTGQKLTHATFSLDHVVPKDRGGKDSFENLVACDKAINQMKGNRLNSEVGLKLLKTPKAPPAMPIIIRPEEAAHLSWLPFLFK